VWELVYKEPPHELVAIVRSDTTQHGTMNQALVLDDAKGDYGWEPGRLVWLGDWDDDTTDWRRKA
jgi:hypothetical protein